MNIKDYIGHRIIINRGACGHISLVEVDVVEISPSGKRVKFKHSGGNECWEEIYDTDYFGSFSNKQIIEDLGITQLKAERKGEHEKRIFDMSC